jgi:hypothetical protein
MVNYEREIKVECEKGNEEYMINDGYFKVLYYRFLDWYVEKFVGDFW